MRRASFRCPVGSPKKNKSKCLFALLNWITMILAPQLMKFFAGIVLFEWKHKLKLCIEQPIPIKKNVHDFTIIQKET